LWAVGGAFSRDINNEWVAVLIDPFGLRAFGRMTRYFSTEETNTILPAMNSFLLANRVLWFAVALALFAATIVLFKPQRAGTGRRLFGKAKAAPTASVAPQLVRVSLPKVSVQSNLGMSLQQLWATLAFDTKMVFKGVPFLVMLLLSVANFLGSALQSGSMFGTVVYPVTNSMLIALNGSFNFMLIFIITFYAGELVFRERQFKIADVIDAMPVPNWVPLLSKCLVIAAVVWSFLFVGAGAGVVVQLIKGGAPVELVLYFKGVMISSVFFILLGLMGVFLQVITNNKFLGYLLMILLLITQIVFGSLDLDHNLYNFAGNRQSPTLI